MSAVITLFQGTEPFNTASFNNRISQINTGFSYVSNPNLLDNWCFGNPVNQRGQTSYTGAGYTIDRWFFDTDTGHCALTLTNEGVKFSAIAGATGIASLKQVIDPTMLSALAGKTVTLSSLGKTDTTQQVLFYVNRQIVAQQSSRAVNGVCMTTCTYTFPAALTEAAIFVYGRTAPGEGNGTILAAKLELGPTQTLAHQENGQWVLNEVPDYGEQLARCQRFFLKIGDPLRYSSLGNGLARDGQFASITIPTPVTMRTIPSLVSVPSGFTMRHSDTVVSGGANFAIDAFAQNSIMLKVQSQVALTPGDMWEAFLAPNGSIMFSADL